MPWMRAMVRRPSLFLDFAPADKTLLRMFSCGSIILHSSLHTSFSQMMIRFASQMITRTHSICMAPFSHGPRTLLPQWRTQFTLGHEYTPWHVWFFGSNTTHRCRYYYWQDGNYPKACSILVHPTFVILLRYHIVVGE